MLNPRTKAVSAYTVQGIRALVVQVGSLLLLVLTLMALPTQVSDRSVRAVLPFLVCTVYLQLVPIIWTRRGDVFSPPALTGFIAAMNTLSTMASFLLSGEVQLDLVKGLDAQQLAELANRCLMATMLGLICYYVGFYARVGVSFRHIFPRVAGYVWDRKRVIFVSVACVLVFGVVYVLLRARLVSGSLDAEEFGAGKELLREDRNLTWVVRGLQLGFVPALFFVTWALSQRRGRPLIVSVVLLAGVSFVISRTGWRGMFMTIMLVVLMLVHYLRRRIPAWAFALMLFGAIVVSNALYYFRTHFEYNQVAGATLPEQVRSPLAALAQLDSERQKLSVMALVMSEFPERHPYLLGQSWMGMVVAPIPRWIWPSKAEHFPWRDTQIVNQLGGGPYPTPYVGVLYANFGWLGIVIGMLVWGILHRALYEWLLEHPHDPNVVLMYALLVLFFGLTLAQVDGTLQYVIPVWLFLRFVRVRTPRNARPALAP